MAKLIAPKLTKNVIELQVAVMQWELTLVEHESKFSEVVVDSVKTAAMRAMLPKDVLERFLDGPFQYEELRNRVSACVRGREAGWTRREQWSPTHGHWTDRQIRRRGRSCQSSSTASSARPIRNTSKSPTTSENPSIVGLPTRHHQRHVNRLQETRNPGVMRRNRVRGRRSVSSATSVVERAILPGSAHQRTIVRTRMKSEQSRPAMLTVIWLVWIGAMTPLATINSVTERNDRTRGGKELMAFVDSCAFDNVLPKSVCTEYSPEATSKSQSGVGFKGSKRIAHQTLWAATFSSQDKRWKQYEHHLGSRGCAQAVDLFQSSAREWSQACIGREAEDPVQECGDTIPLERTGSLFAVRLWIPKGFHRQG